MGCHIILWSKKNLCKYLMKMKATVLLFFFVESIIAINVKELKELRLKLFEKINKQIESANAGAVMYLPLGPGQSIRCPTAADSAAVSLTQMTFLATAMNIFSVVANISNNINNNNNNNNQVSYKAQSNNNVVTNTNVNNGNQVNVMVPVLAP